MAVQVITDIFTIKTNVAEIVQSLLDSDNPTEVIKHHFTQDPDGALDDLNQLRRSDAPEHQDILHQFLTTEGSFDALKKAHYCKNGFKSLLDEQTIEKRGDILATNNALWVLMMAGYKKVDFKPLLDEQTIEKRGNILAADSAILALHATGYGKDDFKPLLDEQDLKQRGNILAAEDAIWALKRSGHNKNDFEGFFKGQSKKTIRDIINNTPNKEQFLEELDIENVDAWINKIGKKTSSPEASFEGDESTDGYYEPTDGEEPTL